MRHPLQTIVSEIQKQEKKLSAEASSFIDEAYKMTGYLQELLLSVKEDILKEGFPVKTRKSVFSSWLSKHSRKTHLLQQSISD